MVVSIELLGIRQGDVQQDGPEHLGETREAHAFASEMLQVRWRDGFRDLQLAWIPLEP